MRTITAYYDNRADAERARSRLDDAGIPSDSARIVDRGMDITSATTPVSRDENSGGFFAALRDFFFPEDDRQTYEEGIRRGGILLVVQIDEAESDRVIDLLEDTGAVDLDIRQREWRSAGWASPATGEVSELATPEVVPGSANTQAAAATEEGSTAYSGTAGQTSPASSYAGTDRDVQSIPIIEEKLRVGKRDTTRGSVRVRSYVVEEPIEEQVRLREERVTLERRPVDHPAGDLPGDAFRERTLEMTEKGEEAVVDKTARVKEELLLTKDADERTETIADTIRRTQVDVEDTRKEKDPERMRSKV